MGKYLTVVHGAELKCDGGKGSSYLRATQPSSVFLERQKIATILDHQPGTNVPPFKKCDLRKDKKCKPLLPDPWEDNIFSGMLIAPSASQDLSINDILSCKEGGTIYIQNSGQTTMLTDRYVNSSPHLADPSCLPEHPRASAIDPVQQARWEEQEARAREIFGWPDPEEEENHEEAIRRLNDMKSDEEKALRILIEAAKLATDHIGNVAESRRKAAEYRRRIAAKRAEIDNIKQHIAYEQTDRARRERWRNRRAPVRLPRRVGR